MDAAARPELPEPVLRRLAGLGVGVLTVSDTTARPATVHLAPLEGTLYALVREGDPILAAARASSLADVRVVDGDWALQVRCRVLHGRSVRSDKRRSELAYWLPETSSSTDPSGWVTVRLLPEHLVLNDGSGASRQRAEGPVRGHVARDALEAWPHVLGWTPFWLAGLMALLQVVLGFVLYPEGAVRIVVMLGTTLASAAMMIGAASWDAAQRVARWRAGLVTDDATGVLLEAWLPEDTLRNAGRALGVGGLLTLLVTTAGFGGTTPALWGALASGGWGAWAWAWSRHLLRHADASEDTSSP